MTEELKKINADIVIVVDYYDGPLTGLAATRSGPTLTYYYFKIVKWENPSYDERVHHLYELTPQETAAFFLDHAEFLEKVTGNPNWYEEYSNNRGYYNDPKRKKRETKMMAKIEKRRPSGYTEEW